MRLLPNEQQIPFYRRTPVVHVEFNPDYNHGEGLIVTDAHGNRGTMSVAAFDATCRLIPGAVVCGIPVDR
jgi:hypothetical protein